MVNKQKARPPKTFKCSKSITIGHRKWKSFSFLGLIVLDLKHFKVLGVLFFVNPLYFNYALLLPKFIYALFSHKIRIYILFCRPESFACKSLLSRKFSTFLHLTLHYPTIPYSNLPYHTLPYPTLHYNTLHYTTLHYT